MAKGAYIGVNNVAHKIKKGYIGVDGIARKIKKAYIGIGGVARPCFSSDVLMFYGAVATRSENRQDTTANSIGNFAIFAGGGVSYTKERATVEAYNSSLVSQAIDPLNEARRNMATAVTGDCVVFVGGHCYPTNPKATVDAYNSSLVKISIDNIPDERAYPCGASVGGRGLIFGGNRYNSSGGDVVYGSGYVYDGTTRTTLTMPYSSTDAIGASNGTLAFFGGSWDDSSGSSKKLCAYDKSLTNTVLDNLSGGISGKNNANAASVGEYVIFPSGDAYNNSLTKFKVSLYGRYCATNFKNWALFLNFSLISESIYVFDRYLILSIEEGEIGTSPDSATSIGNYALFNTSNTVYAYTTA